MSKSAIYTVNTSNQSVAVNGIISPGTIIRRFGPNVNLSGNGIQIDGAGYYKISVNATLTPTSAGTVGIAVLKNNVAIQGANASETIETANTQVNLSISSIVREFCPCEDISNLTFVLTGVASNITNFAIVIEKI